MMILVLVRLLVSDVIVVCRCFLFWLLIISIGSVYGVCKFVLGS